MRYIPASDRDQDGPDVNIAAMASTGSADVILCGFLKQNNYSNYHCCVPFCNSNGRYDANVSFHKIPKNEDIRKKWLVKIRPDVGQHFRISKSTVVCSKHFVKADYTGWTPIRKRLRKDAVPSVFDWTEEKRERRPLKRHSLEHDGTNNKRTKCETKTAPVEDLSAPEDIPTEDTCFSRPTDKVIKRHAPISRK